MGGHRCCEGKQMCFSGMGMGPPLCWGPPMESDFTATGIPPEVVKEIEKLVCQAVKDEVPEDKFVNGTCEELTKKIPFVPEKTCDDVVKKIFDDTMAKCPKDKSITNLVASSDNVCKKIFPTQPDASCPAGQKCCYNLFGHRCCEEKQMCFSGM